MKKLSEVFNEQHREKGRFKPTIPRMVSNKSSASPRPTSDSANVSLRERCWTGYRQIGMKKKGDRMVPNCVQDSVEIPTDAPSIQTIAKKHGVSEEEIQKQLEMGLKVEKEHTSDIQAATEIALDHLNEKPDYYTRLKTIGEANAAAIAAATAIAKKKSGNYDKEGMRKTPYKNPDHPSVKSNEQRRKDMKENFAGDSPQQVAGSAQSTLTDRPNKEPMKKYKELKNITELSTDLLDRYKEKAADDSIKADKEGDTARGDKRFSGVVKATSKQFDNFRKKGFGEAVTDKTDNFKVIKPKESEHETYFKFVTGKAKMGKALSNKEKDFVKSYKLMKQEEVEQIDEISAMAHAKYRDAARKDIKANLKHIHGEYGDIAKNIVNRRMKGLAMSNATTKLKKEEVEQIDENAMHGTVYLHKYHEGSSEDSYGEVGKNHTQHAYKVYHKKPGEKPKLIGDTENNVHNKTKKTAHAVARNDEMEYDHKSHNDAVRHVMDAAGVHSATPIRYIKDKKQMNEEVEQIDELSTNTLKSYHNKALKDMKAKGEKLGMRSGTKKDWKRIHGMETAKSKMYSKGVDPFKEEVESVTERTLSEPETQEKERIVKGMKKGLQGFKQRYGERAKSVMYATATKLAKEETVQEGENTQVKGGDPCWKGYQMVGMKNKGGKKVPNCVPEETQCDTPMNRTTKIAKAAFEAIKDRTKVK